MSKSKTQKPVVPIGPSPRERAKDLQLELFEQAAAARLIVRMLDSGDDLKPQGEVLAGLAAVASNIARTCSAAAEDLYTITQHVVDPPSGGAR